jgi:hypothetical protein
MSFFDTPRTRTLRKFIDHEGPNGTGRVTGLSIEADGVFIYTDSSLWCDDSGAGTFRGDSETAAIRRFYERVREAETEAAESGPWVPVWCTGGMLLTLPEFDDFGAAYEAYCENPHQLTPDQLAASAFRGVMTWGQVESGVRTLPHALPARLNGAQVVRAESHGNGYATITVELANNPVTPFVVATWWPELGTSWQWGHYCRNAREAAETFASVAARNTGRGEIPDVDAFVRGATVTGPHRTPRDLSAAATPAHLLNDYDSAPEPLPRASGTFPMRAMRAAYQAATERCADAIAESMELFSDPADPFESVRDFVDYPGACEFAPLLRAYK